MSPRFQTYYVEFDWLGETIRARILGDALLMDRHLAIDYPAQMVNID